MGKTEKEGHVGLSGVALVCHWLLARLECGPVSLFPLAELTEDLVFVCFLIMLSNPGLCDSWVQLGWFFLHEYLCCPSVCWSWGICVKK